jgi:hypothetical protein
MVPPTMLRRIDNCWAKYARVATTSHALAGVTPNAFERQPKGT